jgi:DNA-binding HxlR family transcriptional regulator
MTWAEFQPKRAGPPAKLLLFVAKMKVGVGPGEHSSQGRPNRPLWDRGRDTEHMSRDHEDAVHETLNRIGDRWTIYVVRTLSDGPKRFSQLKRRIKDISSRMLILTLKKLERDGIVVRTAATQRIDYRLTELGLTFLEPVILLLAWADGHRPEVEAARERYDATRPRKPLSVARTG